MTEALAAGESGREERLRRIREARIREARRRAASDPSAQHAVQGGVGEASGIVGRAKEEMQSLLGRAPRVEAGLDRPDRFVERSGITTALEVAPPVIGGAIGAGAGPAGMLAGGAIGAAAGKGAANIARSMEDFLVSGEAPEGSPDQVLARQTLDMYRAARNDLAFGLGFYGLGRAVGSVFRFAGRATGAHSPEVTEAVREAAEAGIGVGAIDLNKPFFTATSKVAGVIPVIGAPIRKARTAKTAEVSRKLAATLDEISPSVDLPSLGVRFDKAARQTLDVRRSIASQRYAEMYRMFDEAGNPEAVPTEPIKTAVSRLLGDLDALPRAQRVVEETTGLVDAGGRPVTRTVTRQGEPVGFTLSGDEQFDRALQAFLDLPEAVTPRQLEALQKNLHRAARSRSGNQMAANQYRIITEINAATWDALDKMPPGTLGDEALVAIRRAKRSWGDVKALEETAAAAGFKRADRNFFSSGFEKVGSAETDELAQLYLAKQSLLRSPEFIDGLETLVGSSNRKALARAVLARAAQAEEGAVRVGQETSEIAIFNATRMRARLGLSDPEGVLGEGALKRNRQALGRLLDGTGVTTDNLDAFLKTAERIQLSAVGDPSTFLTRRVILGGSVFTMGAGASFLGGGPIGIGAFVLTGRQLSKLISTPKGLKILRDGLKPNLGRQQRLMLAVRVMRQFPNLQVRVEDGPVGEDRPSVGR